jgi:hypothetical protein
MSVQDFGADSEDIKSVKFKSFKGKAGETIRAAFVYEDPKKNVETSPPVMPDNAFDLESHGVKEDLAFFHTVQPGETLFSIAKKYNVQVDGIKALNNLHGDDIQVGSRLIINPNQPAIQPNEESVIPGYHQVRQGETTGDAMDRVYTFVENQVIQKVKKITK